MTSPARHQTGAPWFDGAPEPLRPGPEDAAREPIDGADRPPAQNPLDATTESADDAMFEPDWDRPRRTSRLTVILAAGLVAAAAFTGGVLAQKNHDTGLTAAGGSAAAAFGGRAAAGGFGGAAGFAAGAGGAAGAAGSGAAAGTGSPGAADVPVVVGTIQSISGGALTVTNFAGTTVTVTLTPTATVTTTGPSGLQVGETVSVAGTKAADGSVTATSVVSRASTPPAAQ